MSPNWCPPPEKLSAFLKELTELSRKYEIRIEHDWEACTLARLGPFINTNEYSYVYVDSCLYWGVKIGKTKGDF